jgi:hypothetical protein
MPGASARWRIFVLQARNQVSMNLWLTYVRGMAALQAPHLWLFFAEEHCIPYRRHGAGSLRSTLWALERPAEERAI